MFFRPLRRSLTYCQRRAQRTFAASVISPLPVEMKKWERTLVEAGVPDARESVEYMVAHALGKKTLWVVDPARVAVTDELRARIQRMVDLRRTRVPVQYVIGEWDFLDLTLKMRPPVLIPRPETEEMVERIVTHVDSEPESFLEVGCGSGAISLALLTRFKKCRGVAIDSDSRACALTLENAQRHNVDSRLHVHHLRLAEGSLCTEPVFCDQQYGMIVSNPPYIPTSQMSDLQDEIRRHESHEALDGGEDGLNITSLIIQLASSAALTPGGSLWLEVDSSHPDIVRELADERGLNYVRTFPDYQKLPRVCWMTKP